MGCTGIRHIELCDDCLKNKAEYLLWDLSIFGSLCRLLCRECARLRKGRVSYREERWGKI
jgi:hypothetical protein